MSDQLIKRIENIRNNNNFSTLAFIRLLTEIKPEAAKKAWDKIQEKDTQVINLFREAVMKSDKQLIDQIEKVREENNRNWMDVVRLCFELDSERAREIFTKISDCDIQVRDLSKKISDNG
jgi:hypothetical protein